MMANKITVLFQGDSITDCDRLGHTPYGNGYVSRIANAFPQLNIINKGISGNRVIDLKERWQQDTLDQHPDILCIMIGVNEVWHSLSYGKPYSDQQYESDLNLILDQAKAANPTLKLIMMAPFLFEVGVVQAEWVAPLARLRCLFTKTAAKKADVFIDLQSELNLALKDATMEDLAGDGVHPSPLGHDVIAKAVIKALTSLL
jgi:lysophospholipase L1-like esterase